MSGIEKRSKEIADEIDLPYLKDFFIKMLKEQRDIDIENACEALYGLIDLGCDIVNIEKAKEFMKDSLRNAE